MLALVIDDSSTMRRVLRSIITPLGFNVYEAENGQDALDLLTEGGTMPDIALVDWNMPVMNGLEFIRAVRQYPQFRNMTLMMVTTESEHSKVVCALAAGAHEYIIKPFPSELIEEKLAFLGLLPDRVG
ncbi:MAG: two-component system, chemotaxis family, chemotaxis protein CheY [Actinomycetota bacterium]|nr:two-component system, chemotaxis family, chemotaxis protein CheY [Actinomycetota bacterium]